MRILITGATGFVGQHVVPALLNDGHTVIAVGRDQQKLKKFWWADAITFIECDLYHNVDKLWQHHLQIDVLIHLAWANLPRYNELFHVDTNLPADLKFLKAAISANIRHIMVAGTCLEYGMQSGPLDEEMPTFPKTAYGIAKDTLRKSLQLLQKSEDFILQWVRLFYLTGDGQSPNSLLPQLSRAIDENQKIFNMSPGDQLRDYLPVTQVASYFAQLVNNKQCNGIINCCSGKPISVYQLVINYCQERNVEITINCGHYPYPQYEPLAFWGIPKKISLLMEICSA